MPSANNDGCPEKNGLVGPDLKQAPDLNPNFTPGLKLEPEPEPENL
jgi:hypothetical protein